MVPLLLAAVAVHGSLPPFTSSIARVTHAELSHSYRAGCPVGPSQLRLVRVSYVGFDGKAHHGSLVVNKAVTTDVLAVFGFLYRQRFPIRRMQPIDAYGGSDNASMVADNTSAFNCRYAVTTGPKQWSVHAYGEAIDVNPVENPYLEAGKVLPPAGAAYRDRSRVRPGMAVTGGVLIYAFQSAGWKWGGVFASPDYQHFSLTGG
jgi:D-alanyl-D-alanine carboxypeptidase